MKVITYITTDADRGVVVAESGSEVDRVKAYQEQCPNAHVCEEREWYDVPPEELQPMDTLLDKIPGTDSIVAKREFRRTIAMVIAFDRADQAKRALQSLTKGPHRERQRPKAIG